MGPRDSSNQSAVRTADGALESLLLSSLAVGARGFRFGSVVNFARLYHISLVVILAIPINIDSDQNLVGLSVAHIVRFERQAVLAAQHRIYGAKDIG